MKIIYAIRTKPNGITRFEDIGLGFVNKDGSITLKFHYFPVDANIRIQLRDKEEINELPI